MGKSMFFMVFILIQATKIGLTFLFLAKFKTISMGLFQKAVINKYLIHEDIDKLSHSFQNFSRHFHNPAIQANIINSREEQYQRGFLNDLFVSVLGYSMNPSPGFNLTTEYKNIKDSKKADGAIVINGQVLAVIELKGSYISDLNKIEDQAFRYKNNQPGCQYVITSNFEKLRFYVDNTVDYLEFNLFSLDEKEFGLLWLCLAAENLVKGVPLRLKQESYNAEDIITNRLYTDYSAFKRKLFRNLQELNPDIVKIVLFKKSQKLLDRFLFLFFAEDRQLLPPNSVRLVLNDWRELRDREVDIPLYERFKKYFGYLNTGFKGKRYEVFAYNGGLFKPDEILDNLIIDDEILFENMLLISGYDFASEVDVNILGHIFENSLSELEELQFENIDQDQKKANTRRKKEGVYYTPKSITKYIVDHTLGKLCREMKKNQQIDDALYMHDAKRSKSTTKELAERLKKYRDWLLELKICDPACGSGAFLNQALEFLIDEHRYVDELQAKLFGDSLIFKDIEKNILENNLFGVDINEESVEIARLSLWLRTAQPNRTLNDLSNNIKVGNSLIDDPDISGDKAFNWFLEFPQVFPHYRKPNKPTGYSDIEPFERDYFDEFQEPAFSYGTGSKGFLKHGFDLVIGNPPYGADLSKSQQDYLNKKYIQGGSETVISFIKLAHSKLLKISGEFGFIIPKSFTYASNYDAIRKYVLDDITKIIDCKKVWKEVKLEQVILFFSKEHLADKFVSGKLKGNQFFEISELQKSTFSEFGFLLNDISEDELKIARIIRSSNKYLGDISTNSRGGMLQKFISCSGEVSVLGGAEIQRFGITGQKGMIHKPQLSNYKNAVIQPNSLLVQNIVAHIENPVDHIQITACLPPEKEFVIVDTINQITFNDQNSNKIYWCLLNSKLINWFVYRFIFGKAIRTMHFDNAVTNRIPVPGLMDAVDQSHLILLTDQLLSAHTELMETLEAFTHMLQRKYVVPIISQKLHNWHLLSFNNLLIELNKLKVRLSLKEEAEWEKFFQEEKMKANELYKKTDQLDNEINKLIYRIYGLKEEEIRIIEESF